MVRYLTTHIGRTLLTCSPSEWQEFGPVLVDVARRRQKKRLARERYEATWFRWRLMNWGGILWRTVPAGDDDVDDDDAGLATVVVSAISALHDASDHARFVGG